MICVVVVYHGVKTFRTVGVMFVGGGVLEKKFLVVEENVEVDG